MRALVSVPETAVNTAYGGGVLGAFPLHISRNTALGNASPVSFLLVHLHPALIHSFKVIRVLYPHQPIANFPDTLDP